MIVFVFIYAIVLAMYFAPLAAVIWCHRRFHCPLPVRFSKIVPSFYGISLTLFVIAVFASELLGQFFAIGFMCAVLYGPFLGMWIVDVVKKSGLDSIKRCQSCGYDLTGNVSGVCPECGVAANDGVDHKSCE